MKKTRRVRRTPEEARALILSAAAELLREVGPDGLRVKQVAERAGMSHPSVLHHFGSMDGLIEALEQQISRQSRDSLLRALQDADRPPREVLDEALAAISDPSRARTLAWLRARGRDPFPETGENGLKHVVAQLQGGRADTNEVSNAVQIAVLAMLGEAMFGDMVRARMGLTPGDDDPGQVRRWLLGLLGQRLGPVDSATTASADGAS